MSNNRKSVLRAVASDEVPEPRKSLTITQAAAEGTTRDLLRATRDRIAVAVEDANTPARDLAALTKRLMETVREIEAIDAREREEAADAGEVADEAWDAEAI